LWRNKFSDQETQIISTPILQEPEQDQAVPVDQTAAVFISSQVYRKDAFGRHHPLSIPRVAGVMDLCEELGWLEDAQYLDSPRATEDQLTRFHDPSYVQALKQADAQGSVSKEVREHYRIGTMENPVFSGLYERATTAVGGSILAAERALRGETAFHPSGGTHHGRPDRASGFCYFNDPVFAIMTLLDGGMERVLYVDLDAHHGDGVQDAYRDDPRVFTISIHEEKRWPYSGPVEDRAGIAARNLPVPRGFNDTEMEYVMNHAVLPLGRHFDPDALVVTCGTDALDGDPLSGLALSNLALWNAVEALLELTGRKVVLGGGGYNPWTLIRCWSGLWGRLSERTVPDVLPLSAQAYLQQLECDLVDDEDVRAEWTTSLADRANHGPLRDVVKERVDMVLR
jgi:acetoin utilization protein AcuC